VTKLLVLDLSRDVPCPELESDLEDLYRWYDTRGRGNAPNMGKLCADHWMGIKVHIRDDRERPRGLTDWMQAVPYLVVSRRFAELLQKAGASCEFLPLLATYRRKGYPNEYFALNVLQVLTEAIDLQASEIELYDAEFQMAEGVQRLVLRTNVSVAPMSYLSEIGAVAVSDDLAELIQSEGMLGCRCISPAEFQI
jgi:hypothetical protein